MDEEKLEAVLQSIESAADKSYLLIVSDDKKQEFKLSTNMDLKKLRIVMLDALSRAEELHPFSDAMPSPSNTH